MRNIEKLHCWKKYVPRNINIFFVYRNSKGSGKTFKFIKNYINFIKFWIQEKYIKESQENI